MDQPPQPPSRKTNGLRWAVLVEGGLAAAAVLLAWLLGVPLASQLPSDIHAIFMAAGRGTLATLPLLAGFWWAVHSRLPALRQLRLWMQWLVEELFSGAGIAQLALVAALAGVGEELLFRGVLQWLVGHWTTPLVGLAVASLVFGAFHALSRLYFVLATLIGAYFGWLLLRYGDLVTPMVTHGLYDFLALAYLARHRRTRNHDQDGRAM
jgi:membrane protease YdiL (CAAX protease family)